VANQGLTHKATECGTQINRGELKLRPLEKWKYNSSKDKNMDLILDTTAYVPIAYRHLITPEAFRDQIDQAIDLFKDFLIKHENCHYKTTLILLRIAEMTKSVVTCRLADGEAYFNYVGV